jgi:hypothetical protein
VVVAGTGLLPMQPGKGQEAEGREARSLVWDARGWARAGFGLASALRVEGKGGRLGGEECEGAGGANCGGERSAEIESGECSRVGG